MTSSEFHFANVFFENDFESSFSNIKNLVESHPNYFQLQFLPTIYGRKEDYTVLSFSYDGPLKNIVNTSELKNYHSANLDLWGISNCSREFNTQNIFIKNLCSIDLVKTLSSKLWTFSYTKKFLPSALLIHTEEDLKNFLEKNFYPCILKNPNGFSSRGNSIFQDKAAISKSSIEQLCLALKKTPLIVEPWLKRILDFSTQWFICEKEITCLGATELFNSPRGSYLGNIFYPKDSFLLNKIPEIEYHYVTIKPILEEIQKLGFRGNIGIDAFFYENESKIYLQPIVEINPRKTMGYVTIKVAENNRFESPIFLRLIEGQKCKFPLLPLQLSVQNQLIKFKKNLEFQSDSGVIPHANYENPRWNTFKWNY